MSTEPPVVLITGATGPLGRAAAARFAADGARVALVGRDRARLEAQAAETGLAPDAWMAVEADASNPSAVPAMVDAVVARFGRLDALVNNASLFRATPMGSISADVFDELLAVNARAPLLLAQAAAPHLRAARGAIVNITDIYAERPLARHAAYGMSKAALRMATLALAQALGPEVRVNAVAPGNVLASENAVKAESLEDVVEGTVLQRRGAPADVAGAVLWLLRDATYVTGQTLRVDGGRILGT